MSCIITYKGKKYSEEQFKEYFINNKQEFATSIAKNKDVIDSFKRKMEGFRNYIANPNNSTLEQKQLMEEEIGSNEVNKEGQSKEDSKRLNLFKDIKSASERTFLANNVIYLTSFIISHLNSNPKASAKYFGTTEDYQGNEKLANTDFTTIERGDIIKQPGVLGYILKYIKENYYNPSKAIESIGDFDKLANLQVAYDNFEALVQTAKNKMIELEGETFEYKELEESLEAEDIHTNYHEAWQIGQRHIGVRAGLSGEIRRMLSKLLVLDTKGNPVKDKYGYGFDTFVDPGEAVNSILDWTKGAFNIEDKEAKLEEMKELFPWVNTVLNQIKEEPIRSKFSKNFIKEFIQYSVIKKVEDIITGDIETKNILINTDNATKGTMDEILTSFKEGAMSNLIKDADIEGKGKVNIKNVEHLYSLNTKAYSHFKNLYLKKSKDVGDIPADLSTILSGLGINVSPIMISALINKDLKSNTYHKTRIDNLFIQIDYLLKTLQKNKDRTNYNPILKGDEGNIYGNYSAIINQLSPILPKITEASTFENGKMHYAFSNPSFLGRWINALSDEGGNFEDYIQKRYAESRYFKNGEIWNNQWLHLLNNDSNTRKILEKKSQLHFNGTPYVELGEGNYALSLMHEYFYDKGNKYAWYRVPILSNKPASEFIKFLRYSGRDYKENISRGLKKTFNSEIIRMKTVLERANTNRAKIEGFDITDKIKNKHINFFNKLRSDRALNPITLEDLGVGGKLILAGSGAEFKFLPFLNEEIVNKTELGQLIVDKLNDKVGVDESLLDNLFKQSLHKYMDKTVANHKGYWEKIGLFDKEEKTKLVDGKQVTTEKYKYLHQFGKDLDAINSNLEEYIWNDYLATTNIIQLTVSDLSFFKNMENFQKRYYQVYAPGMSLNITAKDNNGQLYSSDGIERNIVISDLEVKSDVTDQIKNILYDAVKKGDLTQFNADNILSNYGYSNYKDPKTGKEYVKTKIEGKEVLLATKYINVADAQAYSSPTSYRKKKGMYGDWTNEMEDAYKAIREGNFNRKNFNIVWQPLKPFVASTIYKSTGADSMATVSVPIQNKNSEYLLILADAIIRGGNQTNKLTAIFDFMEDSAYTGRESKDGKTIKDGQYNGRGIDTIQFESAVKVGKMETININNLDSYDAIKNKLKQMTYNSDGTYNDQYVHEVPFEDYSFPQEVPAHYTDHFQQMGSQERILIISDLDPNANFRVISPTSNETLSRDGLIKEYQGLIAANIRDSMNDLADTLALGKDFKTKNKAISKKLIETLENDSKYDSDLLRACSLNEDGQFEIPLNDPIQSRRIQELLNSIIKSSINKQQVAGGPIVQVSVFGMADDLSIVYNDDGSVKYFETYMPVYSQELEKALTKDDGTLMSINEAISKGIMTEDMRKAISYRIPTEGKCSMFPVYIKDFLPRTSGEAIMLPKEITTISGSDFDVDKMYVYIKELQSKDNNFSTIEYSGNKSIKENSKSQRNNRIFDLQWAVLTNKGIAAEMFNPSSFEPQKRMARIINILKSNTEYSYDSLKDLPLDKLDEIYENSSNLNILHPYTQTYFHKQNMTAAKLIGIFANNNTSHAFLSLQNIVLNLDNDNQFRFNGKDIINGTKLDPVKSFNNELVSNNIRGFLAASVDAVKDPVLNFMNLNTFTSGPAMLLARLGFDVDGIGLFLTQPLIEKATREYLRKSNEGYVSVESVIQDILDEFKDLTGIDYKNIEDSISKKDFSKKELSEGISKRDEYTQDQLEALLLFKRLVGISQNVNTLTFLTKFNSITNAVGPTIADTMEMEEKYKRFVSDMNSDNAPFGENALDIFKNDPILEAFYETTVGENGASRQIFKDYFPHYTPKFEEVLVELRNGIKGSLDADTINKLVDHYQVFKLTLGNNPVIDFSKEKRSELINEFVKKFKENSSGIVDNDLINIIKVESPIYNNSHVATLNAKIGSYSTDAQEKIKNAWSDLILSEKQEEKDLAIKLWYYNVIRNGFAFSPKTFMSVASVDVKQNIPNDYVDMVRRSEFNDYMTNASDFIYQFKKNNTNNRKLVPSLLKEKASKFKITYFTTPSGKQAVKFNFNNKKEGLTKISLGKNGWFNLIEFDRQLYELYDSNIDGEVTYVKTEPLGNTNNFIEYNGNEGMNIESVIGKMNNEVKEEPIRVTSTSNEDNYELTDEESELYSKELDWLLIDYLGVEDRDYIQEDIDSGINEDRLKLLLNRLVSEEKIPQVKERLKKILDPLCK